MISIHARSTQPRYSTGAADAEAPVAPQIRLNMSVYYFCKVDG